MTTVEAPPTDDEATATAADPSSTPTTDSDPTPEQIADAPVAVPEMPARMIRGLIYNGPADMDGQLRYASVLARARNIPDEYRDNDADAFMLIQRARDLNIPITVALDHLFYSRKSGKTGMSAKLMHALVDRAGHRVRKLHADDRLVRLAIERGDGKPGGAASWAIREAQMNGLIEKDRSAWMGYPGDMLWARCLSRVVRRVCPEATLGMYVDVEVESFVDDAIEAVDLSSAMRDLDGALVPAPDVVELLKDIDTLTYDELVERHKRGAEQGLLGAFGGTVHGIDHTVGELLHDAGTNARDRERRQQRAAERETQPDAGDQGDAPAVDVEARVDVETAPAGTGDRLPCSAGCTPAEVLAQGNHNEGCDRHVARRR